MMKEHVLRTNITFLLFLGDIFCIIHLYIYKRNATVISRCITVSIVYVSENDSMCLATGTPIKALFIIIVTYNSCNWISLVRVFHLFSFLCFCFICLRAVCGSRPKNDLVTEGLSHRWPRISSVCLCQIK